MQFMELPEHTKRILFLCMTVVCVIALIWIGITSLVGLFSPATKQGTTPPPTAEAKNVSPLLFGANLELATNKQQALPSPQVSNLLQNMHVQIVRMTLPEKPSQDVLLHMAQYVKSINAVPLVPLHGPLYPQARADNTLVVQTMNRIFGKTTVYYEYGDEEDVVGVSADQYTASWNATVPQLKLMAPNGHFVGPVTYRYDPDYLRTFLKKAQPLPNEVSWHEFTCDGSWSQQQCLQGVEDWNKHIASARAIMKTMSGNPLPIMITEWNYAANARSNDGKSNNSTFLTAWTKNALQTLAANQVFGSMQYSGIKASAPLISNSDQITTQGQVMRTLYEHFFSKATSSKPTPTDTPGATVTPTLTDTPTVTPTPVEKATDTPIVSPTNPIGGTVPVSPTPTSVPMPTTIAVPTPTSVPTPTAAPTVTPTLEAPTATPTQVSIPTPTLEVPTPTPTLEPPTATPTLEAPTPTPTLEPPTATPTATPTAIPTPKPTATPTPKLVCPPQLQSGSKGTWVKTLQQDLNSRGMTDSTGKPLVVDGDFGPNTQYAVKKWQQHAKIAVDGSVGPQTWHSLGHC